MSFVATSSTTTEEPDKITAGEFWPEVDVADARVRIRLDGTVTDERLRDALVDAIATVCEELDVWRASQIALGHESLQDVPAAEIDGENVKVARWHRAVLAFAKANLTERYADFDATAAGDKRAEVLNATIEDYRRDARWAISDILGRPRNTVELI
ncbi:MAG: head completion/stabilization protein [Moraxellaceae bacterium]|nr:head completion/stabilization protein [Moraxellaceae bacterium]